MQRRSSARSGWDSASSSVRAQVVIQLTHTGKRLTIGVELAAKPQLLIFLDEPTSGLDSQSASSIVRLLRKLSASGQAILCTIHQPSGELFNAFSRLLLLAKGGHTVYHGDLGKNSTQLISYLESRSDKKCAEDANPAEFMLDVIGSKDGIDWPQEWLKSDERKQMMSEIEQLHRESAHRETSDSADNDKQYAASTTTQFRELLVRAFRDYWRSPTYIAGKVGLNVVSALFIGSSFWQTPDSPAGLQLKLFAIFMSLTLSVTLAQQIQPVFIKSRDLYLARERPSRIYSWIPQTLTAMIVEIPFNLFSTTLYFVSWYWMVFGTVRCPQ